MEKLYYTDPYCRAFEARVVDCVQDGEHWLVRLDRTAFYPEGGGQPCDLGTLDGIAVLNVQEADGEVLHTVASPLTPGAQVRGILDWARRFSLMQHHAGDHIVSGLIHNRFGYENVGFHMGAEMVTMDYSGVLTPEQLREIEWEANRVIWDNLASQTLWPTPEELAGLHFRSKKELTGQVRLVRYPGVDLCACCGLHVARTGEIGLIKLLSCVKFHAGCRVEMVCGDRALRYLNGTFEQNRRISGLLSARPMETAQAVEHLLDELAAAKGKLAAQRAERLRSLAARYAGAGDVLLFEPDLTPAELGKLAVAVMEVCGGRCAAFSGTDADGYRYAIGRQDGDLRVFTQELNRALSGRGGGRPNFVQGSVQATRAAIETFFAE